MSKLQTWIKQKFCTHYHYIDKHGRPLYVIYPKKVIWPMGGFIKRAKYDSDAHTCLSCGVKYFDTDGGDNLLSSAVDPPKDWYIGKPL